RINVQLSNCAEDQAWSRLTATARLAVTLAGVIANLNTIKQWKRRFHFQIHRFNGFTTLGAAANIGLVGDDNQEEVRGLKPRTPIRNIFIKLEFLHVTRGIRHSVPDRDSVDYSIAIEKNCRTSYFMLSHFVSATLRAGCEIHKCHTTAWNASVCGVMFAGLTVGMTIATSATCAVYPPSRPTIPRMALPRSFASFSALTKFGLTFFSRLPPPTDKTKIASLSLSRLPLSHSVKTEGHPSSLVRAVSSETLSVGAYASIPASLRKSFTAWEAFAALPPTPRMKNRPPRARTAASNFTAFSQSFGSSFARISVASRKCCLE